MRKLELGIGVVVLAVIFAIPARAQTVSGATVVSSQTSLTLPAGNTTYIYGMATGGLLASSPFAQGNYQQLTDASGELVADLAVTNSNSNSFSTGAAFYTIGGVGVSGFTNMARSFGLNNSPGASSASDAFTVSQSSLVVVVAMAGGQSSLTLSGIPGLQVDAQVVSQSGVIGMVIAHAIVSPGSYTATENSFPAQAAGQDPNHMADLIGVFVFSGSPTAVNLETACVNGLQVDINGVASPGSSVSSISWNWGDGTSTNGFFPESHTYVTSGTYKVQVTANYNDGSTASSSQAVTVGSGIISNCVALTITAGQYGSVTYDASVGSGSVPAGSYTTLQLDFADDLTLSASPDLAFSFSNWTPSAGISGTGGTPVNTTSASVQIVVGAASTVNANFALNLSVPPMPMATPPLGNFPPVSGLFTSQAASFSTLFGSDTSSNAQSWLTSSSIVTNVSTATNFLSQHLPVTVKTGFLFESTALASDSETLSVASTILFPPKNVGDFAIVAAGMLEQVPGFAQVLSPLELKVEQFLDDGASISTACITAGESEGLAPNVDLSCALTIDSGFGDVLSLVARALANDPLDLNYEQVFVPQIIFSNALPAARSQQALAGTEWAASNAIDEAAVWMNAVRVTANRYGTALGNGDSLRAGMQYMAFLNYFGLYLHSAGIASADLTQLANLLKAQGLGTQQVTSGDIQNGLTFLETQGASSPFINTFFTSLGFTPDQIETMIEQTESNPPSPPSLTPVQALENLAAAFATPGVHLIATLKSLTLDTQNDQYIMTLNITNAGASTASNVMLTGATLNGSPTSAAMPVTVGNLPFAGFGIIALTFPASAGAPGSGAVLRISETYSGGTAGGGFRVTLPK